MITSTHITPRSLFETKHFFSRNTTLASSSFKLEYFRVLGKIEHMEIGLSVKKLSLLGCKCKAGTNITCISNLEICVPYLFDNEGRLNARALLTMQVQCDIEERACICNLCG